MPWISSGEVSTPQGSPEADLGGRFSLVPAVKTTWPLAAPGEAGSPFAIFFLGPSIKGGVAVADPTDLVRPSALRFSRRSAPPSHIKRRFLMAAQAVRLPFLVWSMKSLPSRW